LDSVGWHPGAGPDTPTGVRATPIYRGESRLQIDPETAGVLSLRDAMQMANKDQDYLQTQYKHMVSRTLIESLVAKLRLEEGDRYKEAVDKVAAVSKASSTLAARVMPAWRHIPSKRGGARWP